MLGVNYWALVVAAVAAFVASTAWYIAFAKQLVKLGSAAGDVNSPAWKKLFVLGEHLVIAFVLAQLLVHLDVVDWTRALLLGVGLWIAFLPWLCRARSSGRTCHGSSAPSTPETGSRRCWSWR